MRGKKGRLAERIRIGMNKGSQKKTMPFMPYFLTGYAADRFSWLYRHARGEPFNKVITVMSHPELAFRTGLPSMSITDMAVGIITGAALYGAVSYRHKHRKNYRHGQEYGSARWGKKCLSSAGNWGLVDIFGGNLISGLMKHGRMSSAEREIEEARLSLQRFSRELRDVNGYSSIHINDFLTLADFFFDGFLADVIVQSKISEAKRECDRAIRQVTDIRRELQGMG